MDRYRIVTARGALRLTREWVREDGKAPPRGGGGTNAGGSGSAGAKACITQGMSARSRNNMRWTMAALPWEELGPRPALLTLTYPGNWQAVCPNADVLQAHFRAFREKWCRRWGERMTGVWVREFQERGAPHLHCYVGLPAGVGEDEYADLLIRRKALIRLTKEIGKYEARRSVGFLNGEFGRWARAEWVASCGTGGTQHEKFGLDVSVMFWGTAAEDLVEGTTNWARIARYLWSESGKWGQKQAPLGFVPVGRAWATMGVTPVLRYEDVAPAVWFEIRRVGRGIMRARGVKVRSRGKDGMTLYGLGPAEAANLKAWALDVVAFKYFEELDRQANDQRAKAAAARKAFFGTP